MDSVTDLKSSPLPLLFTPAPSDLSTVSTACLFPGCHIAAVARHVPILDRLLSLSCMHLRFLVFLWLMVHLSSSGNNIPLPGCASLVIHHPLKGHPGCSHPGFNIHKQNCCQHSCSGFCVAVSFWLIWVHTWEDSCWSVWLSYVQFCKKLPGCLSKWLHHLHPHQCPCWHLLLLGFSPRHANRGLLGSQCCLNFEFSSDMRSNIFSYAYLFLIDFY